MKANTKPVTMQGLLKPKPLRVAYANIFHEAEHPVFERANRTFSALFSQHTSSASDAFGFVPFDASRLAEVMAEPMSGSRLANRWRALEEAGFQPFHPADMEGEAAPQCVLMLAASHLLNSGAREHVVAQLRQTASSYSRILILFAAEKGEVAFSADSETLQACLVEFAQLAPKPVSLHVVTTEFEDGGPVTEQDLGDALAAALFADIVLEHRRSPRILSDLEDGVAVELSVIGVKGIMFDADSAALACAGRLTSEVAEQTLLKVLSSTEVPVAYPPSPRDLLAALDLSTYGVSVKVGAVARFSGLTPSLQGKDYSASFDCEAALLDAALENTAPCAWVGELRRHRQYLQEVTLPAVESTTCAAFSELTRVETGHLLSHVARILTREGIGTAQELCSECLRRISAMFWIGGHPASDTAQAVENGLSDLDRAVKKIPTTASGIVTGIVRFAPFAFLAWLGWHFQSPFQSTLLGAGCFAAPLIGLHVWWRHHKFQRRARECARRAAEVIGAEMQTGLNNLIRRCLAEMEQGLQRQFVTCKAQLETLRRELTELIKSKETARAELEASRAIKRVPSDPREAKFLNDRLRVASGLDGLRAEIVGLLTHSATEMFCENLPPVSLVSQLQDLVRAYCQERLRNFSLDDLLLNKSTQDFDLSYHDRLAEEWRRVQERPWVFLQNRMLTEHLSQPQLVNRCMIVPNALKPFCNTPHPLSADLGDNVLALIVRVRLAECVSSIGLGGLISEEPPADWVNEVENQDGVTAGSADVQPHPTQRQ